MTVFCKLIHKKYHQKSYIKYHDTKYNIQCSWYVVTFLPCNSQPFEMFVVTCRQKVQHMSLIISMTYNNLGWVYLARQERYSCFIPNLSQFCRLNQALLLLPPGSKHQPVHRWWNWSHQAFSFLCNFTCVQNKNPPK